uniref:Uncharacterized protein n=1 Tax=Nothobranchius kuhntae TaxID=321403 RepID=A0A1A8ISG3_NOTKU
MKHIYCSKDGMLTCMKPGCFLDAAVGCVYGRDADGPDKPAVTPSDTRADLLSRRPDDRQALHQRDVSLEI